MLTDADRHNTARPDAPHTYYGLSTDEKPDAANNGSMFVEMDTGKLYFYDGENAVWMEWNKA